MKSKTKHFRPDGRKQNVPIGGAMCGFFHIGYGNRSPRLTKNKKEVTCIRCTRLLQNICIACGRPKKKKK